VPSNAALLRKYVDVMTWSGNCVSSLDGSLCANGEGFFQAQCVKFDIRVKELPDDIDMSQISAPTAHEIDLLEENCQTNEGRLSQLLDSKQILERRHAELIELRHVLRETARYFEIVRPLRVEG
jgi:hypothetical protein